MENEQQKCPSCGGNHQDCTGKETRRGLAWIQKGVVKTERVEFDAIRFQLGTWTWTLIKTPWGWKRVRNLEHTTFTPNEKS
jgi:hypothetical protein